MYDERGEGEGEGEEPLHEDILGAFSLSVYKLTAIFRNEVGLGSPSDRSFILDTAQWR